MWLEVKKAPNLMLAEMWKELFEAEGPVVDREQLPCQRVERHLDHRFDRGGSPTSRR